MDNCKNSYPKSNHSERNCVCVRKRLSYQYYFVKGAAFSVSMRIFLQIAWRRLITKEFMLNDFYLHLL